MLVMKHFGGMFQDRKDISLYKNLNHQKGFIMKKLFFTLFISTLLCAQEEIIDFKSNCSNATNTITYAVNNLETKLFVTFSNVDQTKNQTQFKGELKNIFFTELKNVILEKTIDTSCNLNFSKNGTKRSKIITFKKMLIKNSNNEKLPSNIIGISKDQLTLPVDYLCESTTISKIKCN